MSSPDIQSVRVLPAGSGSGSSGSSRPSFLFGTEVRSAVMAVALIIGPSRISILTTVSCSVFARAGNLPPVPQLVLGLVRVLSRYLPVFLYPILHLW